MGTAGACLVRISSSPCLRYERLADLYGRHFLGGEDYPAWAMEKKRVWDAEARKNLWLCGCIVNLPHTPSARSGSTGPVAVRA